MGKHPQGQQDPLDAARCLRYLEYGCGGLSIAGWSAREILAAGSPALVYVIDRALQNYRDLLTGFRARWPRTSVHFSLKSCYLLPVVQALVSAGCGLEVMSELELQIAFRCGIPADAVVATGTGHSAEYQAALARTAPKLIVIDCLADLARLGKATASGPSLDIALRVSVSADNSRYVSEGSKLGADWSSGAFARLLDAARHYPQLRVVGLHSHMLGRCADPDAYARAVRDIVSVASELRDAGITFRYIDIGGGLDARFILEQRGWHADDFAERAAAELVTLGYDFELVLEPGRFIAADSAVGLTTVMTEKENSGHRFYIVDIGSNVLIPRPAMEYPVIPLHDPGEGHPEQSVTRFEVGDRTNTPGVFSRRAMLPTGLTGQGLCVLNCGAYTTVFAELWAHALPDIYALAGGSLTRAFGRAEQERMWRLMHGINIRLDGQEGPDAR